MIWCSWCQLAPLYVAFWIHLNTCAECEWFCPRFNLPRYITKVPCLFQSFTNHCINFLSFLGFPWPLVTLMAHKYASAWCNCFPTIYISLLKYYQKCISPLLCFIDNLGILNKNWCLYEGRIVLKSSWFLKTFHERLNSSQ